MSPGIMALALAGCRLYRNIEHGGWRIALGPITNTCPLIGIFASDNRWQRAQSFTPSRYAECEWADLPAQYTVAVSEVEAIMDWLERGGEA